MNSSVVFGRRAAFAAALLLFFALSACGGCGKEEPLELGEPEGEVIPLPSPSLDIASTACVLDADCVEGRFCFQGRCVYACDAERPCDDALICTLRGQCLSEDQLIEPPETPPGQQMLEPALGPEGVLPEFADLTITNIPSNNSRVLVASASDEAFLRFEFSEALPPEGLPYRVERTDGASDENLLQYVGGGQMSADIPIPLGASSPDADARDDVLVTVYTGVGVYRVTLVPVYPAGGRYAGAATVSTFGNIGIPMEFEIVTDPPQVPLEEADQALLVLPVAKDHVFSPVYPTNNIDHIGAPLTFDDFTQSWEASFEFAFDLQTAGIWGTTSADQVERRLRFEIETIEGERVRGSFTDTWNGLYESISAEDGTNSIQEVQNIGTFDMVYVDQPRTIGSVAAAPNLPPNVPDDLPLPPVLTCETVDVFSTVVPRDIGGETYDCTGVTTSAEFEAATAELQARCAVAVGQQLLESTTTTGAQIRSFLDETNMTGQSFEDFLDDCAAGTGGVCQPSPEIQCARELLAHTYAQQGIGSAYPELLLETYLDVARESYLGQQMAAFTTDLSLRKEWLETTDYPAIVTNAVQDLNEQLLEDWRARVLDVHIDVQASQFDPSGLAVLGRESTAMSQDARQRLILEMAQSWRGAMESLTLATMRWNTLLQAEVDRDAKAAFVTEQVFKLYVSASALRTVAQSASAGFAIAGFGSGFATLARELALLGLGFDERVYARDGEVIVNTSVDPESNTNTILTQRSEAALAEIEDARASITGVLATARAEALSETELLNRMNNQIDDLRAELIELCGLPQDCSVEDWAAGNVACESRTEIGKCGFLVDQSGDVLNFGFNQTSVSEAASAFFAIAEASQNLAISNEDYDALVTRLVLQQAEAETFSAETQDWASLREEAYTALAANINERQGARDATTQALEDLIASKATEMNTFLAETQTQYAGWETVRLNNVTTNITSLIQELDARKNARQLSFAGDVVAALAEYAVASLEAGKGTPAEAAVSGGQAGTLFAGYATRAILDGLALNQEARADDLQVSGEYTAQLQDAELANLEFESDLGTLTYEASIRELDDEIRLRIDEGQDDVQALQETAELARFALENSLAEFRDLSDLRLRRNKVMETFTGVAGLQLRIAQAEMQIVQQLGRYGQVVQRAQLRKAKLDELVRQRENINILLGSPAAVFSQANELERAERKLDQAKALLMDWLVALEYYAVRPFMDQRLQIILARNTYQLEEIADKMTQLQRDCGGAVNEQTEVVSLRRDFLGIRSAVTDPLTNVELTEEERFRTILKRGWVPIDKRVRYRTDSTIGSLLAADPNVLAATFFIDLGDFANLALTCNAKVKSVKVNLVGPVGDARPAVTLLYDGTSELLSCQPGIDDYVAQFGPAATSFGRTTRLRTAGRSMSPVATLNAEPGEFGEPNLSFAGLPLATQYTVLIDRAAGENSSIEWDALQDIELELTYTFQDVFPEGQCQ